MMDQTQQDGEMEAAPVMPEAEGMEEAAPEAAPAEETGEDAAA